MQKHIAITGSGASSLSLARLIAGNCRITIISDQLTPVNDKTWCFWDENAIVDSNLVYHQWDSLQIITSIGECINSDGENVTYFCTRSGDFQKHILDQLSSAPLVEFIEARVTDTIKQNDHVQLKAEGLTVEADMVFQSHATPPNDSIYAKERVALKQHFLGWDIQTTKPVFKANEAILMDFRVGQQFGFAFVYVLPFNTSKALVEVTYFTEQLLPDRSDYANELIGYLEKHWNLHQHHYTVEREEFGIIPMVDGYISNHDSHPIYSIGMAAGHAKASTGYAFARIQRDSKRIAQALVNGKNPPRGSLSETRFRYYDLLILNIIRNDPAHAVKVFEELFRKNGFRNMFNFMDETTSFPEELAIMASVPRYSAFFKSMWQTRKRISPVINAR